MSTVVCQRCFTARLATSFRVSGGGRLYKVCKRCRYSHDDAANISERWAMLDDIARQHAHPSLDTITDAEIVILRAISLGLSTKQIANLFGLSIGTIEKLRERLMTKTGSNNAAQLCYAAGKLHLQLEQFLVTKRESLKTDPRTHEPHPGLAP